MRNYTLLLLGLIMFGSHLIQAQSVLSGNWTGILYQDTSSHAYRTQYKFSMRLEEKDGIVKGVSTIISGTVFGIIELKGTYKDNAFTFEEYEIQKQTTAKSFSWCLKSGTLRIKVSGDEMTMEGPWKGYVMYGTVKSECSPGKIVLTKEVGFISLKGNVIDSKSLAAIPARITIQNLSVTKPEVLLNTADGVFDLKLPGSNTYELTVESKDHFTKYERVELSESKILNIPLDPVVAGVKLQLKYIYFERGTSQLRNESIPELNRLYTFLKENPQIRIELQGHTSNEGKSDLNLKLSASRVNTLKQYLVGKGITANRLQTKAFGDTKPLVANDTEENRAKNRRVEVLILNK